jgi:hypothetical protein
VDLNALMDAVILQRPDHFESGTITHVRQTRISMATEIPLENLALFGAIENRAPGLEFLHPVRSLFGMQFRHSRIVQILAAAHRIGKMDAPVIAIVDISHRRGHAAFCHNRVRFAQQRFADQSYLDSGTRRFDRSPQTGAASANYENVVVVLLIFSHLKNPQI